MPTLLPDVLTVRRNGENGALLDLHVPNGLEHFSGHFPGLPILPGVVQIDWAVHYARVHLALSGNFSSLENLKFLSPVLPEAKLTLALDWNPAKSRLEFAYSAGQHKYSSGRIVFGGAT